MARRGPRNLRELCSIAAGPRRLGASGYMLFADDLAAARAHAMTPTGIHYIRETLMPIAAATRVARWLVRQSCGRWGPTGTVEVRNRRSRH